MKFHGHQIHGCISVWKFDLDLNSYNIVLLSLLELRHEKICLIYQKNKGKDQLGSGGYRGGLVGESEHPFESRLFLCHG